uniref:MD-2-related lipid-recognition domain-containing protein n=1 Tax=Stomoxys calcitrans TaxID=35570 RepID=A0A1I8PET1_STOCA
MNIRLIWWTVIATLASKRLCGFKTKFTNLQCDEFDKPFATFKTCRLKALSRHQVSLNVHVQLHQVPVNNVTINAQLLRKGYDNGYKPFMYNNTADFCQFLKSSSRYMFWKIIFFKIVRPISNINHSCPFDHDIIVKDLILDSSMLELMPFPTNEYMVRLKVAAYNHYKAEVRVYLSIYD